MADARETELKIPVDDLDAVRRRLAAIGAGRLHAEAREVNLLLDTTDRRLAAARCALRLRWWGGRCWLTFKGPPSWEGDVKCREEHETEIGDAAAVERILGGLGFVRAVRYDKDRERWRTGQVTVELDRTPMGAFVELEGPVGSLAATARELGLDPARAVPDSYLTLWRRHRERHPELGLPEDMVMP